MSESKISWKHHVYHAGLLSVSFAFCVYWLCALPKSGKALLLLGGVAALMLLADLHPKLKAAYVILIIGLIFIENRALDKERADSAKEQKIQRDEQNEKFKAIADGLSASIEQSQQQFSATMSGIKKSIDSTVGGNSFCYVISNAVGAEFVLTVTTRGENPLHAVDVEYIDADLMRKVIAGKSTISYAEIETYSHPFPTIPFLSSSSGHTLARIPIGANEKRDLQFHFFSMNGVWSEALKLRQVNGQWEQAIKVIKINSGRNVIGPVLYEYTTPNYPKTNGRVDWNN